MWRRGMPIRSYDPEEEPCDEEEQEPDREPDEPDWNGGPCPGDFGNYLEDCK